MGGTKKKITVKRMKIKFRQRDITRKKDAVRIETIPSQKKSIFDQ